MKATLFSSFIIFILTLQHRPINEWLLLSSKQAISHLCCGENKLLFDAMMMFSVESIRIAYI
jgi:hypothetical protein